MDVEWAPLSAGDAARIAGLAGRCLEHDGGLPETASPAFLERRYTGDGVSAVGALADGRLLACGAVRPGPGTTVMTGLVDPAYRGLGLGSGLLDRLLGMAPDGPGRLRAETESLTREAHELFASRGFERTFAEDVHRLDLARPLPRAPLPAGVRVEEWTAGDLDAFYAAYRGSFADRPGFPGWSRDEWIGWLTDDTFLPACSLVARAGDGTPVGFVACAEGFLIQVGCVPRWRRRGLGAALATLALGRMRERGDTEAFLDVNVDNPASAALFRSLGSTPIARRARYERGGR
ncbi:GNAT family N-acetyltransferase [Nonomuraea roseoviolacea]|uniref:Ribosomal protein S18 acetylase RimI-like enzyme n=1 Tax=Nonomuraea roseoviolacea subsp. carminata TaxID=160689 RepID=A0ABT1JV21_9ACTN|nr:GNAT family N-acetyltransferase [Nonomuraea roseoviolacea]MCP2345608.1 ribosomal protein S18 acetylase RimI-like enzyme [Nonomuraea roseoviolacea subsp. carminata]